MPPAVRLRGLRETRKAFRDIGGDADKDLRKRLRRVAEPIAADAQRNVKGSVRTTTDPWAKMRVGVTRSLVYVAPKERGVGRRGDAQLRRPNLANLMAPPMERALASNEDDAEREVDDLLADMERRWGRGG